MRYPGGKGKIAEAIRSTFPPEATLPLFMAQDPEYMEPFVGAGSVAIQHLEHDIPREFRARTTVWLNDLDYGLWAYWYSIYHQPDELIALVKSYREPSVSDFYEFKERDSDKKRDPVRAGFEKLVLHQISHAGNGARAGGPIGGRKQSSKFNVTCRWNPTREALRVRGYNALLRSFSKVRITNWDFERLLRRARPHSILYLDPPYVGAGPGLYVHFFREAEHRRLATALKNLASKQWTLSYDDHPLIHELYSTWCEFTPIDVVYTGGPKRKNHELLIKPRTSNARVS